MSLTDDLAALFFPRVCAACGRTLPDGVRFLCNHCRWEMPLTDFCRRKQNPVCDKFAGHIPFENASAFIYFIHGSGFRELIHKFKYGGSWSFAEQMGRWYGEELRSGGLYADIDAIVPIPLHRRKLLRRGYNQSEYIARGISRSMGIPVDTGSVVRTGHNPSQASKQKIERWDNVEGIFALRRPERLAGRHILLVDDVLTTGATMISCAGEIARHAPDCRLSFAALAVSKHEL
jgi:ComF family protein